MYFPSHYPQLTNIVTAAVDCGARATQTAIDWLTKGEFVPSIKRIRNVMGDKDETNYTQWDSAIDRLASGYDASATLTNDPMVIATHIKNGGGVIVAIHYGVWDRIARALSGSHTFKGYHAVFYVGWKSKNLKTRSYDSLYDGRFEGCPKGPQWVTLSKVMKAARAVGNSTMTVYGVLLHRQADIVGPEDGGLASGGSLIDVLIDMYEAREESKSQSTIEQLTSMIETLEALIGVEQRNPEADETTEVREGLRIAA